MSAWQLKDEVNGRDLKFRKAPGSVGCHPFADSKDMERVWSTEWVSSQDGHLPWEEGCREWRTTGWGEFWKEWFNIWELERS